MSGFPQFPVDGNILSTNVTSDRFSLVENKFDNKFFAAGQYIFYTKNNSIWYKFKTHAQNWSNEILWIGGATSSNTKFDSNGYPLTAYIARDGSINLNRYDAQGNFLTNSVATSGYLPTVAINSLETYLFWIPPNYTNFMSYADINSGFSTIHAYPIIAPGQIQSMQIELVNKNRFLFTFEVDNGTNQKVYVAFTDPAAMLVTYELPVFLNFIKGYYFNENLIIGELLESNLSNLFLVGSRNNLDILSIQEYLNKFNLKLVQNRIKLGPEYFIISEEKDFELTTAILLSFKLKDDFGIPEPKTSFNLKYSPQSKGNVKDYFIVQDVSNLELSKAFVVASIKRKDVFHVADGPATAIKLLSAFPKSEYHDALQMADSLAIFDLQKYSLPSKFNFPKELESFVIFDSNDFNGNKNIHFNTLIIKHISLKAEYFDLSDATIVLNLKNVQPISSRISENINVFEYSNTFKLFQTLRINSFENFYVNELSEINISKIFIFSKYFSEFLEIKENNQKIIFYPNFDGNFYEQLNVSLSNVVENLKASAIKIYPNENFYIQNTGISTVFYNDFKTNLPEDAGIYNFNIPVHTINGLPLVTFTSNTSSNIISYYYYLDNSIARQYRGPLHYSINILGPQVFYKLNLVR